ncbi:MAG: hypothetical protein K9L22_05420 [Methylococcaceae bacterium]|nr:hypothetical protein [Methylococcaceae bacterium]
MKKPVLGLLASSLFLMSFSFTAKAEECDLKYTMKGWSAFYKTYKGSGVVTCPSGKKANVDLSLKGGGLTFGASEITEGKGKIRGVKSIDDIYGGGFELDGHAGFIKSIEGRWVPRGSRTVTLSGKGTGYNLGWSMGSFKISKP